MERVGPPREGAVERVGRPKFLSDPVQAQSDAFLVGDEGLGAAAVLDEIGDRADLQLVLYGKFDQIGQSRHFPIVFQDLANHRGRR